MSKERFKIPTSLDMSYLDLEFSILKSKDGVGVNKPFSAKTIVFFLGSIVGLAYLMFNSFVGKSGFLLGGIFVIVWVGLTIMLSRVDTTKRSGVELLLPLVNYFMPNSRKLSVRSVDEVAPLQILTGVKSVDEEDGLVHYVDGTVGFIYQIVGSASILMFEDDKRAILEKVDTFYRNLSPRVEIIFDTVYESQKTENQVASLERRYKSLSTNSPGLKKLYNEQYGVLKYGVGERFKSLHQYLIVKADNIDALDEFEALVKSDLEGRGLMFKLARPLPYNDVATYFHNLYGRI